MKGLFTYLSLCVVGLGVIQFIRNFTQGSLLPISTYPSMVLDTSLLNTQQYKVRIKCKVEQS